MPYKWTTAPDATEQELHLWPHQSLPARGFVVFIYITFIMLMIPAMPLLGTSALWGLLPFCLLAVGGMYFALQRNHKALQIDEVLTLSEDTARLIHRPMRGEIKEWDCNRYWATAKMYKSEGPVPYYVTLRGNNREVEIGAFLSEDERVALYGELQLRLRR